MTIEKHVEPTLPPGRFQVWYERSWNFTTLADAEAFAQDLHERKSAERAAYQFSPPIVHLYVPKESR